MLLFAAFCLCIITYVAWHVDITFLHVLLLWVQQCLLGVQILCAYGKTSSVGGPSHDCLACLCSCNKDEVVC